MERVLDTYKKPYNPDYPVICMDESPKQLIEDKASIPIKVGKTKKVDYEYIRRGTANIFIANEPLTGKRYVKVTERKTKKDWAIFMKEIAENYYPEAKQITLVMDNYSTHNASSFYETYSPEEAKKLMDSFNFVNTPKHGSWLNMAEIELHVLNGQCLNRHISTIEELIKETNAWQNARNNKNKKINWQFTNDKARIKLTSLYPTYST